MFPSSRSTEFLGQAGFAVTLLLSCLNPAETAAEDPAGIVWFVGSVTGLIGDRAAIDMGEAHSLRIGDALSVFRGKDDHYVPLGILTIADSRPTRSLMARTSWFQPQVGDVVIYMKSLKQLGTGAEFQDEFLKHQVFAAGTRNRYSSQHLAEESETLQRFMHRQPQWVKEHKPVAGAIRSASVSRSALDEMQPLLNQILTYHEYQSQGIPVDKAVGAEWSLVLSTLVIRDDGGLSPDVSAETVKPLDEAATGQGTESASVTSKAAEIPIESIRRHVDKIMFTRSPEERRVATLICTAVEQYSPLHERLWISQQLRNTQFASLADDFQLLLEFEAVLQKLREEQKS